jgi:Ca2+-binding RTX toxin-like protein
MTFESLEARRLLSVTLHGGTLRIIGTDSADHIQLSHPIPSLFKPDTSRTFVDFNGEHSEFKTSAIKRILIDGREGNDRIQVGIDPFFNTCGAFSWPPDPYPFEPTVPALLLGGAGADTLIGGAGQDRIFGGAGSDFLDGSHNDDFVSGGAGDDALLGGSGDDRLRGGAGDDGFQGGAGLDLIFGQAGNDWLDGDNSGLSGSHERDQMFGGSGDDTIYADAFDDLSGGEGDDLLRYEARGLSIDGTVLPPLFEVPSDIERTEPYYFGGECY